MIAVEELRKRLRKTRENANRASASAELAVRNVPTRENEVLVSKCRGYLMALDAVERILEDLEGPKQNSLRGIE